MSAARLAPLCIANAATFWPWHRWPEFARWENPAATVVVPLAGTADWGLDHALDAEETVLMHVLRAASRARPATLLLLVVPPLRWNSTGEPARHRRRHRERSSLRRARGPRHAQLRLLQALHPQPQGTRRHGQDGAAPALFSLATCEFGGISSRPIKSVVLIP